MQIRYAFATAVFLTTAPGALSAQANAALQDIATATDQSPAARIRKLCSGPSSDPAAAQILCNRLDDAERPFLDAISDLRKALDGLRASDPMQQAHCRDIAARKQSGQPSNRVEDVVADKCADIAAQQLRLQGNISTLEEIRVDFARQHLDEIVALEDMTPHLAPPLSILPSAADMPSVVAVRNQSSKPRRNFAAAKQSFAPPPPDPVTRAIGNAFHCVFSLFTSCSRN